MLLRKKCLEEESLKRWSTILIPMTKMSLQKNRRKTQGKIITFRF